MKRIMGDEQVANRELKPQTTTTAAVKTSLKKLICVLTNFIAFIWTRSIRQIQTTFPGDEFFSTLSRFKTRKEYSSSYVHVLHKTSH